MKKTILITSLLFIGYFLSGQVVYEHLTRTNIYDFLDELANQKIIRINSVVKPYSREFIAKKLTEASEKKELLNKRQQSELKFYLRDYDLELTADATQFTWDDLFKKNKHFATGLNPIGLHYRDSIFALSIRPIWGIDYYFNHSGSAYHRWGGLEGFAYIGKNVGIYTSLRDNHEDPMLTSPKYFNQNRGAPEKPNSDGSIDYSEARGGIMVSWKWGAFGVLKDHFSWGDNYYGSNILSGRTPSFAQIKLHLYPVKWFEFNYIHGWLVSEVVDSTHSYWDGDTYRTVFHNKFIAANMFTFIPVKGLNISIGNSIIYSDIGVQAAYLVPFLFYKSVDHTLNGTGQYGDAGQNSQMYLNISSRNIKYLHLYGSLFVDDFSIERITDKNAFNPVSYKGGFRLSNFPIKNLSLTGEYTYTLPITYQHYISTTTFETNHYNLGHYMRDNSQDVYVMLRYQPIRGLRIDLAWNWARHFNDYVYGVTPNPVEVPVMEDITWQNNNIGLNANYEFVNNAYIFAGVTYSDIQGYDVDEQTAQYYLDTYSPTFFQGKNTTIRVGFNIGF